MHFEDPADDAEDPGDGPEALRVVEEAHEVPSLGGLMVLAFLKVHGVLEPLEMVLGHEEVFAPTYMVA